MTYSMEEQLEAQRQLDSLLRKLDRALATLESRDNPARCASQITLAKRRIRALEIARSLLADELEGQPDRLAAPAQAEKETLHERRPSREADCQG